VRRLVLLDKAYPSRGSMRLSTWTRRLVPSPHASVYLGRSACHRDRCGCPHGQVGLSRRRVRPSSLTGRLVTSALAAASVDRSVRRVDPACDPRDGFARRAGTGACPAARRPSYVTSQLGTHLGLVVAIAPTEYRARRRRIRAERGGRWGFPRPQAPRERPRPPRPGASRSAS
jgi:hypothetical protein